MGPTPTAPVTPAAPPTARRKDSRADAAPAGAAGGVAGAGDARQRAKPGRLVSRLGLPAAAVTESWQPGGLDAEQRAELAASGDRPPAAPHPAAQDLSASKTPVMEALGSRWPGESRTSERMSAQALDMFEHLEANLARCWPDVEGPLVVEWCWKLRTRRGSCRRASQSTARKRQWIARGVFEEAAKLGANVDPAAAAGERIACPAVKPVRPLTDPETARAREIADSAPQGSRQPLVVALASAGGSATNIARVCVEHIDLNAATVAFCGPAARVGSLDGWAVRAVRRYLRDNSPVAAGVPLCVSTRTTSEREVESVSWHLRRMLKTAGLYELEGVAADSIRLNAARRVLDTDGIVAAARFLGWRSLDRVADVLGHNWRNPDG